MRTLAFSRSGAQRQCGHDIRPRWLSWILIALSYCIWRQYLGIGFGLRENQRGFDSNHIFFCARLPSLSSSLAGPEASSKERCRRGEFCGQTNWREADVNSKLGRSCRGCFLSRTWWYELEALVLLFLFCFTFPGGRRRPAISGIIISKIIHNIWDDNICFFITKGRY